MSNLDLQVFDKIGLDGKADIWVLLYIFACMAIGFSFWGIKFFLSLKTPKTLRSKRNIRHNLSVKKAGYNPYRAKVNASFSDDVSYKENNPQKKAIDVETRPNTQKIREDAVARARGSERTLEEPRRRLENRPDPLEMDGYGNKYRQRPTFSASKSGDQQTP